MGNPILAGLGFSLPKRQVSNHDLVGRINTSDEFIVERTGVRTRYHVEPEQAVSALMVPAARQAIEAAGQCLADLPRRERPARGRGRVPHARPADVRACQPDPGTDRRRNARGP